MFSYIFCFWMWRQAFHCEFLYCIIEESRKFHCHYCSAQTKCWFSSFLLLHRTDTLLLMTAYNPAEHFLNSYLWKLKQQQYKHWWSLEQVKCLTSETWHLVNTVLPLWLQLSTECYSCRLGMWRWTDLYQYSDTCRQDASVSAEQLWMNAILERNQDVLVVKCLHW